MQIPASDPKPAPCLSPRRTRPVALEPSLNRSPVAVGRQCQSQAWPASAPGNTSPGAARCTTHDARCTLPSSPVREMGPGGIKLSTADLAALNRAILETPTGRGDDAPAALRRDPLPGFRAQNSVRRVNLQWCDGLHILATASPCNCHSHMGHGLQPAGKSFQDHDSESPVAQTFYVALPCLAVAFSARSRHLLAT